MRLEAHLATSLPLAGAAYLATGSLGAVAGILLGGVLIDADHLLEFWIDTPYRLNLRQFFRYGNSGTNTKIIVFLHSYELLFILVALAHLTGHAGFFLGTAAGMALHIALDTINIMRKFGYGPWAFLTFSFLFRLVHLFDRQRIEGVLAQPRNQEG